MFIYSFNNNRFIFNLDLTKLKASDTFIAENNDIIAVKNNNIYIYNNIATVPPKNTINFSPDRLITINSNNIKIFKNLISIYKQNEFLIFDCTVSRQIKTINFNHSNFLSFDFNNEFLVTVHVVDKSTILQIYKITDEINQTVNENQIFILSQYQI